MIRNNLVERMKRNQRTCHGNKSSLLIIYGLRKEVCVYMHINTHIMNGPTNDKTKSLPLLFAQDGPRGYHTKGKNKSDGERRVQFTYMQAEFKKHQTYKLDWIWDRQKRQRARRTTVKVLQFSSVSIFTDIAASLLCTNDVTDG